MARRSYTAEFKREAVRLASNPGLSRRQAAKQLGIHPNVLAAFRHERSFPGAAVACSVFPGHGAATPRAPPMGSR